MISGYRIIILIIDCRSRGIMRETGRPSGKSMAQRIEHITVCSWLHHSFTLSLNFSLSQPGHGIGRNFRDTTQMLTRDSERCRRTV